MLLYITQKSLPLQIHTFPLLSRFPLLACLIVTNFHTMIMKIPPVLLVETKKVNISLLNFFYFLESHIFCV